MSNPVDVPALLAQIAATAEEGARALSQAAQQAELESSKGEFLGRRLPALSAQLRSVPGPDKKAVGQAINVAKTALEKALAERLSSLRREQVAQELKTRAVDVSLPGRRPVLGHLHPIRQVQDELLSIFRKLGYSVVEGPEAEEDRLNFEALNFPHDHPARDMQDTFFLDEKKGYLLRTHTSPVQIRTMLGQKPPVQVVMPGAVYRNDSDVTHSPMFHQLEILCVDEGISLADLKGTLLAFVEALYGKGTKIRLRPSFFPFTEPSVEVDVSCVFCKQAGCRVCKQSGWLEILGAGMVDPNVFASCNQLRGDLAYDPERYTGFAAGLGIERIAMLKYGIDDIRVLFENDARFLSQF
jgi:phenylalanyl-tRNA synthetase alpha chain